MLYKLVRFIPTIVLTTRYYYTVMDFMFRFLISMAYDFLRVFKIHRFTGRCVYMYTFIRVNNNIRVFNDARDFDINRCVITSIDVKY